MPDEINEIKQQHYSTYMTRADAAINEAYTTSQRKSPGLEESTRNSILNFIARAMALAEIAKMNNPPRNQNLDAEDKEAKKKTEEIRNSEDFLAAYGSMTVDQLHTMLGGLTRREEGKVKADDKTAMQAKTEAILDYVLLRGGKVRDHEYGRDRFDAFLKGLGEIMEPEKFLECCNTLNERREQWYGNTSFSIHAENYVPTAEKREALRKLQGPQTNQVLLFAQKQLLENDMAEIAQRIDEVREIGDKTNEELQAADADYTRIESDQKAIEMNSRDSHGNTFYERNQQYLDRKNDGGERCIEINNTRLSGRS